MIPMVGVVAVRMARARAATTKPLACNSCRFFVAKTDDAKNDEPKVRQPKVKKKPKPVKKEPGRDKNLALLLAALEAPIKKEPPISDEEKARRYEIGRNYVIGKMREHNEIHHDLTCKLHMKHHAVKMLPRKSKLKEEALKVSDEYPPLWRDMPTWTPPIPGFNPADLKSSEF